MGKKRKVQFDAVKETERQKIKSRIQTKKKKGIRPKSASSSRSREKNNSKKKKVVRAEKAPKADADNSEEDPDVSEIVLTKPQIKNISLDGFLPGNFSFL